MWRCGCRSTVLEVTDNLSFSSHGESKQNSNLDNEGLISKQK